MEKFLYEESIDRITKIIETLESGEISLNESYNLFNEAKSLIKKCETYLDECEKEFEILMLDDDNEDQEIDN